MPRLSPSVSVLNNLPRSSPRRPLPSSFKSVGHRVALRYPHRFNFHWVEFTVYSFYAAVSQRRTGGANLRLHSGSTGQHPRKHNKQRKDTRQKVAQEITTNTVQSTFSSLSSPLHLALTSHLPQQQAWPQPSPPPTSPSLRRSPACGTPTRASSRLQTGIPVSVDGLSQSRSSRGRSSRRPPSESHG